MTRNIKYAIAFTVLLISALATTYYFIFLGSKDWTVTSGDEPFENEEAVISVLVPEGFEVTEDKVGGTMTAMGFDGERPEYHIRMTKVGAAPSWAEDVEMVDVDLSVQREQNRLEMSPYSNRDIWRGPYTLDGEEYLYHSSGTWLAKTVRQLPDGRLLFITFYGGYLEEPLDLLSLLGIGEFVGGVKVISSGEARVPEIRYSTENWKEFNFGGYTISLPPDTVVDDFSHFTFPVTPWADEGYEKAWDVSVDLTGDADLESYPEVGEYASFPIAIFLYGNSKLNTSWTCDLPNGWCWAINLDSDRQRDLAFKTLSGDVFVVRFDRMSGGQEGDFTGIAAKSLLMQAFGSAESN